MRRLVSTILLLTAPMLRGAVPASAPTTSAATRPQDMEPLVDGSLRYLPPKGWEVLSKGDDRLSVAFRSPDGLGRIDLTVTPQPREPDASMADQMAMIIGKS